MPNFCNLFARNTHKSDFSSLADKENDCIFLVLAEDMLELLIYLFIY